MKTKARQIKPIISGHGFKFLLNIATQIPFSTRELSREFSGLFYHWAKIILVVLVVFVYIVFIFVDGCTSVCYISYMFTIVGLSKSQRGKNQRNNKITIRKKLFFGILFHDWKLKDQLPTKVLTAGLLSFFKPTSLNKSSVASS